MQDRALAVRCDVTEWEDQQRMVSEALAAFGQLDVVFANAGFGAPRGFLESDTEHWRAMVLTNVYGAALTIRATLPAVRETRGHVLLTGSVAGRRALPGSLYSATKWAVTAMGESLRQEVDGTGIRVTLDRARDGRHAVLRQPSPGGAGSRRHRAGRDVRRQSAAACRRERDPGPPDLAERVTHLKGHGGGADAYHMLRKGPHA